MSSGSVLLNHQLRCQVRRRQIHETRIGNERPPPGSGGKDRVSHGFPRLRDRSGPMATMMSTRYQVRKVLNRSRIRQSSGATSAPSSWARRRAAVAATKGEGSPMASFTSGMNLG